jgi:hypothetical protein
MTKRGGLQAGQSRTPRFEGEGAFSIVCKYRMTIGLDFDIQFLQAIFSTVL